ncbi:MAG: riboflavin synthase [Candidatus Krumholzibacteria bacterium]|nr:riboflavin synthase [Candidatus Krumholzibacteria bacterium]
MFTGLVEALGTVRAARKNSNGARLTIETPLEGLVVGESVSVDGVCQTVAGVDGACFSCDVLRETLRVSTFGRIRSGSRVNVERALAAGGRFGGHIVNGHVDGTGTVTEVVKKPLQIEIALDPELLKYLVPKGSVAVNGVSLTVGPSVKNGRFAVFVIPHTWERTNLKYLKTGGRVNVEIDVIAKYVERYLACMEKGGGRR